MSLPSPNSDTKCATSQFPLISRRFVTASRPFLAVISARERRAAASILMSERFLSRRSISIVKRPNSKTTKHSAATSMTRMGHRRIVATGYMRAAGWAM